MRKAYLFACVSAALVIGGGVWWYLQPDTSGAHLAVTVPALSNLAQGGEPLFNAKCAACHGQYAAGSNQGPPLIHKVYHPGHHADRSFQLAVQNGAQAHHWQYGNMPPVEGITPSDVARITLYVRELQRANGIF